MSHTRDMSCEQVRQQAYRYRRGELIGAETSAIDSHVEECATCRDYYERLGILLESASAWDTSVASSDADDLFAGIAARLEAPDEPDERELTADFQEGVAEQADEQDDEEFVDDDGSRRWVPAVIGLAAGVLLTLAALWAMQESDAPENPPQPGDTIAEQSEEPPAAPADKPAVELTQHETKTPEVDVFASDDAEWTLSGDESLVLALERGELLVEFVPEGDHTLRVDAPGFSVQVVGTIFYVSADEQGPQAGVLAGEVKVSRDDGESTTLTSARELDADFEARPMPKERVEAFTRYVDAEEHNAKLAELARAEKPSNVRRARDERRADPAPKRPDSGVQKPVQPQPKVAEKAEKKRRLPPDLERLRSRAERATRGGQYHDAVRYYRTLLERLPPMHPIAASVHLDLAHIYLHRLNSPGRAAPYLRTFVERWPADVAADTARRELCKIAEQTGEPEPGCEVQR